MADLAQHAPAMKVGGRRLSVSSKPRLHAASSFPTDNISQRENADYPRPAPPGEGEEHAQAPPHNEEEAPKKEKKHGHGNHDDNRLKESIYRKIEGTRPTRDLSSGPKNSFGAGGRIAQPSGKVFSI